VQFILCLLVGLVATVEDLWRRRISNCTVLAGLAVGLALQIALRGWMRGPAAWLGGAAVGFGVFLIFFLAGGMGGGDIKLMAALGACLGPAQILRAALITAVAGALLACGHLFWNWIRRRESAPSIPYAPAILIGSLLSFL
jgi:prepilin peptidase CpaA